MATPDPIAAGAAPARWRSYYELTKPRVVMLIVFTSIVGTLLAVPGMPPLDALIFGNLGVGLAAASAAVINHVLDERIDAVMSRTKRRPLPTGKMSARAVARMYAALVDEVDGVRLVPPARLREISSGAVSGVDEIMGFPTTWALGYSVGRLGADPQETKSVLGIGGVGGSFACADTATGVTWALTKNRLTAGFEAAEQISEIVTKAVEED